MCKQKTILIQNWIVWNTTVFWHLNCVVIYEDLYFDLAQGQINGAPNETRTHSCRFASLTC